MRRSVTVTLSVTLLNILIVGCPSIKTTQGQCAAPNDKVGVPAQVRFIAAGIADAREKFRCGQASVTSYRVTYKDFYTAMQSAKPVPPGILGNHEDEVEIRTGFWYYRIPDLAIDSVDVSPTGEVMQMREFAANAGSVRVLTTQHYPGARQKPTNQGLILPREMGIQDGLPRDEFGMDPREYAFFAGSIPLDRLLLDKTERATPDGEETLDGSRCVKIRLNPSTASRWEYWIDVDHGFVLRRAELYHLANGKEFLQSQQDSLRLSESGGTWIPTAIQIRFFLPKKTLPQYHDIPSWSVPFLAMQTLITVSNLHTDSDTIPAKPFSVVWPPRTPVQDVMTGKNYVTPGDAPAQGHESEKSPAQDGGLQPGASH